MFPLACQPPWVPEAAWRGVWGRILKPCLGWGEECSVIRARMADPAGYGRFMAPGLSCSFAQQLSVVGANSLGPLSLPLGEGATPLGNGRAHNRKQLCPGHSSF